MVTIPVTSSVSSEYPSPTQRFVPPAKMKWIPDQKAYQVVISNAAQAKSLKLEGYSVSAIALKLKLDVKTVSQYLGIAASASKATYKSTSVLPKSISTVALAKSKYTPPKSLAFSFPPKGRFTVPKATYVEPKAITKDGKQLTALLSQQGMEKSQAQPGDENTHLVVPLAG